MTMPLDAGFSSLELGCRVRDDEEGPAAMLTACECDCACPDLAWRSLACSYRKCSFSSCANACAFAYTSPSRRFSFSSSAEDGEYGDGDGVAAVVDADALAAVYIG